MLAAGCSLTALYLRSRDVLTVDDSKLVPSEYMPPRNAPLRHQYDVAVIGGGLNGLHVALAAQRRGMNVVLFEARDLGSESTGCAPSVLSSFLLHINRSIRMRCPEEFLEAWEQLKEIRRMSAFLPWNEKDADVGLLRQDVGAAVPCFSTSTVIEVAVGCAIWWLMSLASGSCSSGNASQRSAHRPVGLPGEVGKWMGVCRWLPFWCLSDVGVSGRVNNLGFRAQPPTKPIAPMPPLVGVLSSVAEAASEQIEPKKVFYMRFLRVDGFALCQSLARQISFMGGSIYTHTSVQRAEVSNNSANPHVVLTVRDSKGRLLTTSASRVVNCTGAWCDQLRPNVPETYSMDSALLHDPSPSRTNMYGLREAAANRDIEGKKHLFQGYQQNMFLRMPCDSRFAALNPPVNAVISLEGLALGAPSLWPWGVGSRKVNLLGVSAAALDRVPTAGSAPSAEELRREQETSAALLQCAALDGITVDSPTPLGSTAVMSASMAPMSATSRRVFFSDIATNVISIEKRSLWYDVYGGNHLTARRNAESIGLHLAKGLTEQFPQRQTWLDCRANLRPIRLSLPAPYEDSNERIRGAVQHSFATTLSDVLLRRVDGIGFTDPSATTAEVQSTADTMALLLSWTRAEKESEVKAFLAEMARQAVPVRQPC